MGSQDSNLTSHEPLSQVEHQGAEAHAPESTNVLSALPPENPPWNLIDVLAVFAFAVFCIFAIGGLALAVAHFLPWYRHMSISDLGENAGIIVATQTVMALLVVAFMVQIVRFRHRGDFLTAISWNAPAVRTVVRAIAAGVAIALLSEIYSYLVSRWVPKSLPMDKLFRDANSAYLLAFYGVLVAPFGEELFFRGLLYPALARRFGVGISVLVTAGAFAIIHQSQLAHAWLPLAWLYMVGVLLTVIRVKTKSVATCVIVHVTYNATLFILVFIGTQGFRHMDRLTSE